MNLCYIGHDSTLTKELLWQKGNWTVTFTFGINEPREKGLTKVKIVFYSLKSNDFSKSFFSLAPSHTGLKLMITWDIKQNHLGSTELGLLDPREMSKQGNHTPSPMHGHKDILIKLSASNRSRNILMILTVHTLQVWEYFINMSGVLIAVKH